MDGYRMFKVQKEGHLAWVYLNRPGKRNALGQDFWQESPVVFKELAEDDEIRAVILAGKGDCFSAGLDLTEVAAMCPEAATGKMGAGARTNVKRFIEGGQRAAGAPENCPKPVIAAIHGYCIGAGLDLAAACDVRLCTRDAVFSLRESRMGIVADVGVLQRLPYIIGQGWTRQLAFTGMDVDAEKALEIGLVNDVVDTREDLLKAAERLAKEMAESAPLAVQGAKETLNFSMGRPVDAGLCYVAARSAMVLPSEDLIEAVAAFVEKRRPRFSGK